MRMEAKNVYIILVGKHEEERSLGRSRRKSEVSVDVGLEEI